VEPADHKRYVLPIIFLRSFRCGTTAGARNSRRSSQTRRAIISATRGDPRSRRVPSHGGVRLPEAARWENLRKAAQADDIKVKLDDVLEHEGEVLSDELRTRDTALAGTSGEQPILLRGERNADGLLPGRCHGSNVTQQGAEVKTDESRSRCARSCGGRIKCYRVW